RDVTARDDAAPGLGYPCYGTLPTRDSRLVASWTAGGAVLRIGDGAGVRLRADRKMVIQVHFNIIGPGTAYRSSLQVDLELDDDAHAREEKVLTISAEGTLPLRQHRVELTARQPI